MDRVVVAKVSNNCASVHQVYNVGPFCCDLCVVGNLGPVIPAGLSIATVTGLVDCLLGACVTSRTQALTIVARDKRKSIAFSRRIPSESASMPLSRVN